MADSGTRRGIGGVPMQLLVLFILGFLVIVIFGSTVGLRLMRPNFRTVELSHPHPILFVDFVVSCIMDSVTRGGIGVIGMVSLVTHSGTVFQGLLLELIRFWFLLF